MDAKKPTAYLRLDYTDDKGRAHYSEMVELRPFVYVSRQFMECLN